MHLQSLEGGGGYRLITFKKSPKNRLKVMEKRVEYVHVELWVNI